MRRNCNLELCLFPSSDSGDHRHQPMMEEAKENESPQQQLQRQEAQKLTIFYDGKICARDVTEVQARAILMMANKQMEEKVRTAGGLSEPSSPILNSNNNGNQLYSPSSGLSMKRSLQRFLQERKNRIQEASPYHH